MALLCLEVNFVFECRKKVRAILHEKCRKKVRAILHEKILEQSE